MKLHVIFTGGTIGSRLEDKYIAKSDDPPYLLLNKYMEKNPDTKHIFTTSEPYSILSENLSAKTLTLLIRAVQEALDENAEGIIITHGTDTLQYSASMLDLVFYDLQIPVCLVSSQLVLEDPNANGFDNFDGAIAFIEERKSGVYVAYRNPKEDFVRIHRGKHMLLEMAQSADMHSTTSGMLEKDNQECPNKDKNSLASFLPQCEVGFLTALRYGRACLSEDTGGILWLKCHPGMSYSLGDGITAIIIESYHSGTICVDDSFCSFARCAEERNIPIYLTGMDFDAAQYETVKEYQRLRIVPSVDTAVTLYNRLWLQLSFNYEKNDI